MKKLIFLVILTLGQFVWAQTPQREMGITPDERSAIVSQIKDVEIRQLLEDTAEFRECRDKYQGDAQKIEEAKKCFRDKLQAERNPEKLKKMANALGLQQYGLVKGNTAKDIQEYLNKKMYQSMTGVNPDEEDNKKLQESLKFKNKKHIDQSVFIKLYKNQVTKNSLYEISRYCFEKFRVKNNLSPNPAPTFAQYWSANKFDISTNPADYTDDGSPSFGSISSGGAKEKVYEEILNNIGPKDFSQWNEFFEHCGKMIKILCDDYKGTKTDQGFTLQSTDNSQVIDAGAAPSTSRPGGPSCLALGRLQEYRQALINADKIEEQFAEMVASENQERIMAALMNGDPKIFGKNQNDESLDSLTNYTSRDVLEGNLQAQTTSKFEKCQNEPQSAECADFIGNSEEYVKIQQKVELEMTLKREVEMARVRELRNNKASLEEYLKENGFFDILKEHSTMSETELVQRIGKEFDARKNATLQEIQTRMGSRQVKVDATDDEKKDAVKKTAEEAASERARLAQVVLFNNIITSHLELKRRDSSGNTTSAGRNVGAWRKEQEDLEKSNVDQQLFSNLQDLAKEKSDNGIGQNDQFGGLGFIEMILGKPPE